MLRSFGLAAVAALLSTFASAQNTNTTLLKHYARSGGSSYSDVWGYSAPDGKEFAIFGDRGGISILDTTTPTTPKVLGFYPVAARSYAWRDYTNLGRFIYAVSEHHRGMRIFEILANGTVKDHGFKATSQITSAHNVRADPESKYIYVVGGNNRGMAIYDANKDPVNPKFVAVWNSNYIHDACYRRGKGYLCCGGARVTRIYDMRNPLSLKQISAIPTAASYNHSAWVSDDDKLLCVCNEIGRGSVRPHMEVFDISDPTKPVKRGDYDLGPGSIAHNVFVIGRAAYMSYYGHGVHMIDLDDPTKPTKFANYRTAIINSSSYYGTWGVYPFADSGVVYASDMQRGFFAIQVNCGHMNRFGAGTANTQGVPRARFDGTIPKVGGSKLRIEIENLQPSQQFWLAVSAGKASSPSKFLGANVNVDLSTGSVLGPFAANAQGKATLPAPIPNNSGLGNVRVYMQLFSHRGNGTLSSSRGMWAGICK